MNPSMHQAVVEAHVAELIRSASRNPVEAVPRRRRRRLFVAVSGAARLRRARPLRPLHV